MTTTATKACSRCGARNDEDRLCAWPSGVHKFYPLANAEDTVEATVEATVEMVSVPRDLLRHLRCDLLLAFTDYDHPLAPDVADLLRKDREELLALVPYAT